MSLLLILLFQASEEPVLKVQPDQTDTSVKKVQVYFVHPIEDALVPVERTIFINTEFENQIKQAVDQLTIAPDPMDAISIWPSTTYIRELYLLESGLLVIDFDGSFLRQLPAGATKEILMVYSLVHTVLNNFEEINSVYLLIDGRVSETFLGQIDIERPLKPGPQYLVWKEPAYEEPQ